MKPTPITLDFETYFDSRAKYSLRSMPTIEYVRDPRFKAHGASIAFGNEAARWIPAETLTAELTAIDWSNTCFIGHNLAFDALILREHYGFAATTYFDTLAAARALFPHLPSHSLDAVGSYVLSRGKTDSPALDAVNGLRDLTPAQNERLGHYANGDVELTRDLGLLFMETLPAGEQQLMSLTTRMATWAQLELDVPLITEALAEATTKHEQLLAASPVSKTTLGSNPKFAAWMESQGIVPPTKLNKKGKTAFAFAKDDRAFLDIIANHPEHAAVWAARLGVKSTLDISRAQRFLSVAKTGLLPVPLNYYAAHTGRWGGADGINLQNLRRKGKLRRSIRAPKGYRLLIADASQIELRFNAWFCDELWLLDVFLRGDCPYCAAASQQYGRPVTREDVRERQFGKVLELGLGYNMGWPTLRRQLAVGMLGLDPIFLEEAQAQSSVAVWRNQHGRIASMWRFLHEQLSVLAYGAPDVTYPYKCVQFTYENIILPNGMCLNYDGLRKHLDVESGREGWVYGEKDAPTYIYGGKLLENIIQALARIALGEQMLKIDQLPDTSLVLTAHDEAVALAPEEVADERLAQMLEIMSTPPSWAPGLPAHAEGHHSECYSK